MREIYSKKRSLGLLVLLTMLVQIFVPFLETGKVYADSIDGNIDLDLQIVGAPDREYRSGDIVRVRGNWNLPNDNSRKQYKEGDSFTISIPEGLEAAFSDIHLSDMAVGVVDGDNIVFTFNENVEQLVDRQGGFNLMFRVKDPKSKEDTELPIVIKDGNGDEILKDSINITVDKGEVVGDTNEYFNKGAYATFHDSYGDGLVWYIRVNKNGKISKDGNKKVTLRDSLVGDNHIFDKDSFIIKKQKVGIDNVGNDKVDPKDCLTVSDDKMSFVLDLNLEADEDSHDGYWYDIEYRTIYTGNYIEDLNSVGNNAFKLKNKAILEHEDGSTTLPQYVEDDNIVNGEFNLGGWANGRRGGHGKVKIKKIDKNTREPLPGVKFLVAQEGGEAHAKEITTDENGEAFLVDYYYNEEISDIYVIKEIQAPDGYILDNKWNPIFVESNKTITVEIENEKKPINITGEKKWEDSKGKSIESQSSVVLQLYQEINSSPKKLVRQIILDKGESKFIFKNLPVEDEDGNKINYVVKEYIEVNGKLTEVTDKESNGTGYTSEIKDTEEGFIITNTKEPEKISIPVSKTWEGVSKDTDLPEITVKLLANEKEVKDIDSLKLNSGNGWQGEFKNLPKYDDNGEEIDYTVKEVDIPNGYTSEVIEEQDSFIITNTYNPEKLSIPVKKVWEGVSEDTDLPEVTVKLLANEKEVKDIDSLKLNSGNGWQGEFKNLPKFDESGEKIEYTVKEVDIPNGYTSEVIEEQDSFIITNTYNPEKLSIPVKKVWEGVSEDTDLPEVTVKLLANGKEVEGIDSLNLNSDNEWQGEFKDLPKYDESGEKIEYTVKEVDIPKGYDVNIKGNAEDGFEITNTYNPEKISIPVTKFWKDSSENELKDKDLPEVTVELLADGEKLEGIDSLNLNSDNEWQGEFKNLPKYDESGEKIEYTVKEVDIPKGYDVNIKGNAEDGFTITNTYNPGKLSIPVTKAWEGVSEDTDLPEVTVKLLANGKEVEGIDSLNLNSDNEWQGEFKDLPKYDESGEKIEYTVKEVDIPKGYDVNIKGNAEDGFTITNTYNPGKLSIPVTKAWEGVSEDTDLPEVTVKLLANGKEVEKTIKLNKDNQWQGKFEDLPKYNESGKEIKYSVKEINIPKGYDVNIKGNAEDGFTIINTYNPGKLSIPVKKVWKDSSENELEDTDLPEVTVKLLADGKEVEKTIKLNKDNQWQGKFEDLPKYNENGKEIKYKVIEVEVKGYKASYEVEGNKTTITNTKIEEPKPESKTTSVSVNKVWKGTALDNVTVKLLADGKEVKEVILSEDNNWTHTFEELDKFNDESGKEIEYTVKEVKVEGYTANITGNAKDGFTITNTEVEPDTPEPEEPEEPETPEPVEPEDPPKPDKPIEPEPAPETVSLTVKKAWVGEPTERVLVQLVANGQGLEVVELRESNNWTHVFSNLVKYNSDGSEIEYSVVEIDVPDGYTEEYSRPEEDTILITNIKDEEPEEPEPIIPEPEEPEEPETPEPVEPEEPETPEPVEPEEPETPEPVEPEEPENPEPVEPEEPENPEEDEDGSKNPNKPGDEEPEEDVDGVIVEKPEDPEEDGSGSKNPNKPGDKEETETDASQETKLPKTGSNSLDYYLLGLLLLLIGLLLKKRERVTN